MQLNLDAPGLARHLANIRTRPADIRVPVRSSSSDCLSRLPFGIRQQPANQDQGAGRARSRGWPASKLSVEIHRPYSPDLVSWRRARPRSPARPERRLRALRNCFGDYAPRLLMGGPLTFAGSTGHQERASASAVALSGLAGWRRPQVPQKRRRRRPVACISAATRIAVQGSPGRLPARPASGRGRSRSARTSRRGGALRLPPGARTSARPPTGGGTRHRCA
jgi:hypothetical protein